MMTSYLCFASTTSEPSIPFPLRSSHHSKDAIEEIKQNLIDQLTGAVRWTQSVQAMIEDGAYKFTEAGPGKVLQGLVLKINKETY